MKKLLAFILIFALSVSVSGCFLFSNTYDFSYASAEKYKSGNAEIADASALKNIHLRWFAGNVTIKTHDKPSLLIEETTVGVTDDVHKVHYWYSTNATGDVGTLFVEFGKSGESSFDGMQKDLTITLPENDNYYFGINSDCANVSIDLDDYKNTLRELTVTTNTGAVQANISSASTVQIAGYNNDEGSADLRVYELNALGKIYSLGMNSSYAKVIINAHEVGTMGSVGSVFNETRFTVEKANVVKLSCTKGVSYIDVKQFNSMELEMREKPVYITLPADCEFTLNKTKEKVFDGEEDMVSDLIDISFENVTKLTDTKYTVGSGEKAINIITYNEIHIGHR
ncbi:MAG: hypothetical protein E7435_03485 [Ruminococcaceae bacterium]|nr:hypothetical protein [Oscillospiraceae bacterium]